MTKEFITKSSQETKEAGKMLAEDLRGGEIICLQGELGAGKTTFTQGLLEGLGAPGPYTSPTFVIMKKYEPAAKDEIQAAYHFDVYRVGADDMINLGWEEIIADPKKIVIIEWPEKISQIIPEGAVWISFEWMDENKRKINIIQKSKSEIATKNSKLLN